MPPNKVVTYDTTALRNESPDAAFETTERVGAEARIKPKEKG